MHSLKGKKQTKEHIEKRIAKLKGKKRTIEQKLLISQKTKEAMKNLSLEKRDKMSSKGRTPWNKGKKTNYIPRSAFKIGHLPPYANKKMPIELRIKLSFAHGGDGTFTSKYGIEFDNKLKRKIFERDNFKCRNCNKNHKLVCHHIDQNKFNNSEDNLITLCRSCHSKAHNYYLRFFQNRN